MAKKKTKKTDQGEDSPVDPFEPVFTKPEPETAPVENGGQPTNLEVEKGKDIDKRASLHLPSGEPFQPTEPEEDKESARRSRLVQKNPSNKPYKPDTVVPDFDPLQQKLFEAPDGHIMVGGIKDKRMWYPQGKMFINPKHERLSVDERAQKALAASRKDAQE